MTVSGDLMHSPMSPWTNTADLGGSHVFDWVKVSSTTDRTRLRSFLNSLFTCACSLHLVFADCLYISSHLRSIYKSSVLLLSDETGSLEAAVGGGVNCATSPTRAPHHSLAVVFPWWFLPAPFSVCDIIRVPTLIH